MITIEQPEVVFERIERTRRRRPFTWYSVKNGAMLTCCEWQFALVAGEVSADGRIVCLADCCNRPGVLKGFKCN